MTHRFTNCTFDLRGVDYACVSRGDEFEIGHIGEGERALIDGDTLDFTGLHILGPVALAERIKVAVELECQFLTTERGSLRTEIDTLRDELAKEKAKGARLVRALEACVSSLERADTAEGVCCCGDSMEGHGAPMNCGHSPVDMGDYYASKALEASSAALAAYEVKT